MNENGASTNTTEGLWVFGSTILHECAAVVTFQMCRLTMFGVLFLL